MVKRRKPLEWKKQGITLDITRRRLHIRDASPHYLTKTTKNLPSHTSKGDSLLGERRLGQDPHVPLAIFAVKEERERRNPPIKQSRRNSMEFLRDCLIGGFLLCSLFFDCEELRMGHTRFDPVVFRLIGESPLDVRDGEFLVVSLVLGWSIAYMFCV